MDNNITNCDCSDALPAKISILSMAGLTYIIFMIILIPKCIFCIYPKSNKQENLDKQELELQIIEDKIDLHK